jgi:hypothetical protein
MAPDDRRFGTFRRLEAMFIAVAVLLVIGLLGGLIASPSLESDSGHWERQLCGGACALF